MVIFIPASHETREMLLFSDPSNTNDIRASEAYEYINRYKQRIAKLDELTKNETGVGRIDAKKETMGWRFPAKELKEYVNSLADDSELLILFGVGEDMLTHVIITEPDAVQMLKPASRPKPSTPSDDPVVGKEHGSSCCGTKTIEECFKGLFT